jgi:glycosyltransferase involved in cell wall biosynthesis
MSSKQPVDICLLLEGTYPYVRGGVSSWLHQIIEGLKEYTFHIIFLGDEPNSYTKRYYQFPANVKGFEMHYLLSDIGKFSPSARKGNSDAFEIWNQFSAFFEQNKHPIPGDLLAEVAKFLGSQKEISMQDFLYSEASWKVLTERYAESAIEHSFVDYFWTYRNIYQPLFVLSKISQNLPNAKVFHSVSTGYAGFLGALCKQTSKMPFLLTEHGIYTKERKIDLAQATWIKDRHSVIDISMHKEIDITRKTWIRYFEQLGLTAYDQASKIISLFEGNRKRQHQDGADENKTQVIVNGIDTKKFLKAYDQRPDKPPMVVGLVGRVVPIKDIKTFIRTIRALLETIPNIEGWIIGPRDEDKEYTHECELLIESLGLNKNIKMLGSQNVVEMLPQLGVMILTSISEAQPLVLLEAMAAGIPCVATDVGACREIIEGALGVDASIGKAGAIVPIANPIESASAVVKILQSSEEWKSIGDIGIKRVTKYYDESLMYESYRQLYKEAIQLWPG